jgi:hypothetical protein
MLPRFAVVWVLVAAPLAGAPFSRGDVDQSGSVDISDPVGTLMYLFHPEPPPAACLDAADANDSGAIDLADAIYTLSYLFAGGPEPPPPFPSCGEDTTVDDLSCGSFDTRLCGPVGTLISSRGCKTFEEDADVPPSRTCIEYGYDGAGLLSIAHVNAGFNCCPGVIFAIFAVEGDRITIVEGQTENVCDCECLFDLDMRIEGIEPGTYTIEVVEIYPEIILGERLVLTVDLADAGSGDYCVERTHYPWGVR